MTMTQASSFPRRARRDEFENGRGIVCPKCGQSGSRCTDSRAKVWHGIGVIKRGKTCRSCGTRWITVEMTLEDLEQALERQQQRSVVSILKAAGVLE